MNSELYAIMEHHNKLLMTLLAEPDIVNEGIVDKVKTGATVVKNTILKILEAIKKFIKKVINKIRGVFQSANIIKKKTDSIEKEFKESCEKMKKEFDEADEKRRNEFNDRVEKDIQKFNDISEKNQKKFDDDTQSMHKKFEDNAKRMKKEFNDFKYGKKSDPKYWEDRKKEIHNKTYFVTKLVDLKILSNTGFEIRSIGKLLKTANSSLNANKELAESYNSIVDKDEVSSLTLEEYKNKIDTLFENSTVKLEWSFGKNSNLIEEYFSSGSMFVYGESFINNIKKKVEKITDDKLLNECNILVNALSYLYNKVTPETIKYNNAYKKMQVQYYEELSNLNKECKKNIK